MIGEPALLKISLKCKPGQLAQLFGNFALMNAALALVAATSLGRTNHALPLPALQTLQSQPVTSAALVSQALGIRDLFGPELRPIGEDLCVMSWFSDFRGSGGIDWSAVLPADA